MAARVLFIVLLSSTEHLFGTYVLSNPGGISDARYSGKRVTFATCRPAKTDVAGRRQPAESSRCTDGRV